MVPFIMENINVVAARDLAKLTT
jgi:hypothetical protein